MKDAEPKKVAIHDDSCGAVLDADGRCPVCKFIPDMQSIVLITPCPEISPMGSHRCASAKDDTDKYADDFCNAFEASEVAEECPPGFCATCPSCPVTKDDK